MMNNKILRLPEVLERLGIGETTYRTFITEGLVPELFPLGPRSVGVLESEINLIIRARVAEFSNEEIKRLVAQIHEKRVSDAAALRTELSI